MVFISDREFNQNISTESYAGSALIKKLKNVATLIIRNLTDACKTFQWTYRYFIDMIEQFNLGDDIVLRGGCRRHGNGRRKRLCGDEKVTLDVVSRVHVYDE